MSKAELQKMAAEASRIGVSQESTEEALQAMMDAVNPVLAKLERAVNGENQSHSTWIKEKEARALLSWISTFLDQNSLLVLQIQEMEKVLGQLDAEVKRLNKGKGLWTP